MSDTPKNRSWPPADQRRAARVPLLVLRVAINDGQRSFFGYAKNISRSGLFIATISPREPGTVFDLEIPLPNVMGIHLHCSVEIVWKRRYDPACPYEPGMGLRFIDLPEDVAAQIDTWVKQEKHAY